MSRRFWYKWIKAKYIVIVILYLSLLIQSVIRQSFVYSYNKEAIGGSLDIMFDGIKLNHFNEAGMKVIGGMYYVGYTVGHTPGGILTDLYGGRYFLSIGLLLTSIISIISPYIILYTPWFLTAMMEFIVGLCEGLIIPAEYSIVARWIPDSQITFFAGTIESCLFMARIIIIYLTAYLENYNYFWRHIFKTCGGVGLVLCVMSIIFVYSTPWHSKIANQKERDAMEFIVGSKRPKKINWKGILRDEAVWAITFQHISHKCLFYVLSGEIETLKKRRYEDNLWHISTILWLVSVNCWVFSFIVNHLINQRKIPRVYLRAICNTLGSVCSCFAILLKNHIGTHSSNKRIYRIVAFFLKGIHFSSGQINVFDLTRLYSGTIIGLQNSLAGIIGYFMQLVISASEETPDASADSWKALCDVTFSICVVTTLIYFIWARAERADWDVIVVDEDDDDDDTID